VRSPFTQIYLHAVWSRWDRLPLLMPSTEREVYAAICDKCQKLKCQPLAIGGTADHVHLLVRFPTTLTIADLLKEVKGSSSHLVTHELSPGEFFKWQGSYGAFTVSKNLVPNVVAYIQRQKEHHDSGELWPEWEQTFVEKASETA
jgi:putative transposase